MRPWSGFSSSGLSTVSVPPAGAIPRRRGTTEALIVLWSVDLLFAAEDTPEPLKDAFAALLESLGEVAGDGVHPGLFTEVFWAALHGLATLTRAGRLPPAEAERRVELLVDRLAVV